MKNETITAAEGFRTGAVACGLKRSGRLDLAVLVCEQPASAAACFTTNTAAAAPVQVSREHVKSQTVRGLVVNSGNANACTGSRGLDDAARMTQMLADKLGVSSREILVASTGLIGEYLDMEKIACGIDRAYDNLRDDAQAGRAFAEAIMTTDTKPKQAYREFSLAGRTIRIAGAAKGSGMMAPNMATMLAFITTDARIAGRDLQTQLSRAVGATFNRITIDGQMSTNDMVAGFASGMAGDGELSSVQCETFGEHLHQLCNELALAMVADGEGATRVFHVTVAGGRNAEQVHKIARAVADSLLVKTAVHGADPNWGRIVSAAGAARAGFDPQKAVCSINGVVVFKNGEGVDHDRAGLAETMTRNEVEISLELGAGDAREVMHSCDLSKKYVDINALYHT